MSSLKWPVPSGPDADVMLDAVSLVADRSFFAVTEPCDEERFASLSGDSSGWLVASVKFTEEDCKGEVSCALPEDLAYALFDAFSGRDPEEPAPERHRLLDLVGEFANMVCGSWLTRLASQQTFSLAPPVVRPADGPDPIAGWCEPLLLAVNDRPLAVTASIVGRPGRARTVAGA